MLDGVALVGRQAHQRVRLGLARTFQKIRLFKHLSVLDNVVAGFHIHHDIPAWQYVVHGAASDAIMHAAATRRSPLTFVGSNGAQPREPHACLRRAKNARTGAGAATSLAR